MKLVTSNPPKYAGHFDLLETLQIGFASPLHRILEVQSLDLAEVGKHKADATYAQFHEPVIVDDVALLLDAYPHFPGALTKLILQSIGISGIQQLIAGKSHGATLVCVLSLCEGHGKLAQFTGTLHGTIDAAAPEIADLPLNGIFVPDGSHKHLVDLKRQQGGYPDHRDEALNKLVEWLETRGASLHEAKRQLEPVAGYRFKGRTRGFRRYGTLP